MSRRLRLGFWCLVGGQIRVSILIVHSSIFSYCVHSSIFYEFDWDLEIKEGSVFIWGLGLA
jgi:hypothetical protein